MNQIDVVRQAIEERDEFERMYHDLSEHMRYLSASRLTTRMPLAASVTFRPHMKPKRNAKKRFYISF